MVKVVKITGVSTRQAVLSRIKWSRRGARVNARDAYSLAISNRHESSKKSHESQNKLSFLPPREDQAALAAARGSVHLPDMNHVVQNNICPSWQPKINKSLSAGIIIGVLQGYQSNPPAAHKDTTWKADGAGPGYLRIDTFYLWRSLPQESNYTHLPFWYACECS